MLPIKKNNYQTYLFNLIIFLFQFEFIGDGVFSIYRMLIFPLVLLGLLYSNIQIFKHGLVSTLTLFIFFFIVFISDILSKNYIDIISVIGNISLFIFMYSYFYSNSFKESSLWILISYSLFHLYFLVIDFGNYGLGNRFSGYHWDPNYMCAYVLISFWAKIYLLGKNKYGVITKTIILFLSILDLYMIFLSLSKGGALALILIIIIFLFVYNRLLMLVAISLISSFFSYALVRSNWLVWSSDLDLLDSIIYRFFTKSIENDDISTGRLDFIKNYINLLKDGEGIILGVKKSYFIDNFNNGNYPHNSIVEICLAGGVIAGLAFVLVLLYNLILVLINIVKFKTIPYAVIFAYSTLIIFMFLTFMGLKLSFMLVAIVFCFSNKKIVCLYKNLK